MKCFEEIIKQKPVFLHNWKSAFDVIMSFEDVCLTEKEYTAVESPWGNKQFWQETKRDAEIALEKHKNENILFASYNTANWSGDAFVLFERDGVLYEVNGTHCSCYGLENQWDAEETSIAALEYRLKQGTLGRDDESENEFYKELCQFLGLQM